MTDILEDLSLPALTAANEANLFAFARYFDGWPRAEVYNGPELSWCITDIANAFCNVICHNRLEPEQADATIEAVIAKARARNVPLHWFLDDGTEPSDMGARLEARGFARMNDAPCMAVDLTGIPADSTPPPGLNIIRGTDDAMLQKWCHVASTGFGFPDYEEPALLEWCRAALELEIPVLFYLGWCDAEPVATSLAFLAEGVAGLYFVATLPGARCRGFGRAITLAPLKDAREMGYRVATLQASEAGARVYRKIGFIEHSKIGSLIWRDDTHRTDVP